MQQFSRPVALDQERIQALQQRLRIAACRSSWVDFFHGFITDCMSVYFEWPFLAALESIVVARTDPDLMARILPVMERYRVTCDDIWMGVFEKAGIPIAPVCF